MAIITARNYNKFRLVISYYLDCITQKSGLESNKLLILLQLAPVFFHQHQMVLTAAAALTVVPAVIVMATLITTRERVAIKRNSNRQAPKTRRKITSTQDWKMAKGTF